MSVEWGKFVEIVNQHQRFLLTSHIRPDCDALGSELGMAEVLRACGKQVRIVNGQSTPHNLRFIDPDQSIQAIGVDVTADQLRDTEVLIILDTSAWAQLGPMSEVVRAARCTKAVIDHHQSEDDLGAEPFKDVTAEATGSLVVHAADALRVPLTPQMANPLFAAVATDTGWFRFPSVSGETYRVAARLMDAGAVPSAIYNALYEQDSVGRIRLRGMILSRTVTELDGSLVHTYVAKEDYGRAGAVPTDTEDVINLTLAIAGTQFAVIFVEQPEGGFKLSFRSRCHVNCSKLAEKFGGGGHQAAAGAFLPGALEDVQAQVLKLVREALQQVDARRR